MEIQEEWLETILAKHPLGRNIVKVKHAETEPVVSKGNNYASNMMRIRMDVILNSGEKSTKYIILKSQMEDKGKIFKEWGLFKKEIKIFKEVLPCMESLLQEIGQENEVLWCQCIESRPYDRLVFEDLRESGYKMGDKKKNMDLAHASLALKGLAKFHALSVALKERGIIDPSQYKETIFTTKAEMIQIYHDGTFRSLADAIETSWEPEYHHFAKKLRNLIGKTVDRVAELHEQDENEFNVLNHGDCWLNNMMFKYIPDSVTPCDVKFVDFQLCSFNVPGLDLQYLISTSVKIDVKKTRMDKMFNIYHETLCDWLKKLNYSSGPMPTIEDVKRWTNRMAFFGFITACMSLNFMITDPENAPDLDEMIKEIEEKKSVKVDLMPYMEKEFIDRMKFTLEDFSRQGVL